ncbi:ileal sodium/bile acid cotransporter-like [Diadema setosum]|uniref:ileal sodium/bile acid cotransporter-like n=1 Tax=Diadema setosum TaxID=31175 RepID=UPI003B3AD784
MSSSALVIILLVFVNNSSPGLTQEAQVSFGNLTDVYVHQGQDMVANVTVTGYRGPRTELFFKSESNFAFTVINGSDTRFPLNENMFLPATFRFVVRGKNLAVSSMRILVSEMGSRGANVSGEVTVKVLLRKSQYRRIVNYLFIVPMTLTYTLMGILLDLKVIWECIRRPLGITIGCVCQFGIMPALAFGIGKALRMDSATALGLLLVGCCPGGNMSNHLSLLVGADYMLSVTMTVFSTVLALGATPLNLLIYSPRVVETDLVTPYGRIATQLLMLIVPLFVGVLIRLKFPQANLKVKKIIKPCVAVTFVVVGSLTVPLNLHIFFSPWKIYVAALLLPFSGALIGGTVSMIARLKKPQVIAIAFETGVQNGTIAYIVLLSTFPKPEATLMARVAFVAMMMAFLEGGLFSLTYYLVGRCRGKKKDSNCESEIDIVDAVEMVGTYKRTDDNSGIDNGPG